MKILQSVITFIFCLLFIFLLGCGDSDVDTSKPEMTNVEAIEYLDKKLNDFYIYTYMTDNPDIRTRSVYQGVREVYDIRSYWLVTVEVIQEIQRYQNNKWTIIDSVNGKMNLKYYKDDDSIKLSE